MVHHVIDHQSVLSFWAIINEKQKIRFHISCFFPQKEKKKKKRKNWRMEERQGGTFDRFHCYAHWLVLCVINCKFKCWLTLNDVYWVEGWPFGHPYRPFVHCCKMNACSSSSHRSRAHCGEFWNATKSRWRKRRKRSRMTALEFVPTRTPSVTMKQFQIYWYWFQFFKHEQTRAFSFKNGMPEASLNYRFPAIRKGVDSRKNITMSLTYT